METIYIILTTGVFAVLISVITYLKLKLYNITLKHQKLLVFSKRLNIIKMHDELNQYINFMFNEYHREKFIIAKSLDQFSMKDEEVRNLSIEITTKLYNTIPAPIFETYIKYLNIPEEEFQEILIHRVRAQVVSLLLEIKGKYK